MPISIHDKSPEGRRKMKEGPKAQEQWLEGIYDEWFTNHATKDKVPETEMPTQDIQDRYALAEEETRMRELAATEDRIRALEPVVRTEVVARTAAQDMQLYGHLRESTYAEMLDLELDPIACGVIPPRAV